MAPSVSSRGKRQQVEVEIELPARKKTEQAVEENDEDSKEIMKEQFRVAIVGMRLEIRMNMRMRQQIVKAGQIAWAAEMTNVLL